MRGLTLVELMVAIVIMLVITMATVMLYSVNSQSHRTVDSSQEMDGTARYIFTIMSNSLANAGYSAWVPLVKGTASTPNPSAPPAVKSLFNTSTGSSGCSASASTVPCPIIGFESGALTDPTSTTDFGSKDNGDAINGSGLLAVRFYGSGADAGDGNVITCNGRSVPAPPNANHQLNQLGMSIFWISTPKKREAGSTDEEPSLYCTDNAWSTTASPAGMQRSTNLVARGVEVMHIMYAEDRADATGTLYTSASTKFDDMPDQWVNAADVFNWQRVKAVRVGFVLRGPVGSGQLTEQWSGFPLGIDFVNEDGAYKFTAASADNRLRKVYTATFMLRNNVNL